ncbi:efflux RND transporter periplasmic adaptor subunit [Rheinheimera mangrovi]|uniref:efflux RND transporter periplasmic adaptor subunit n=1 Tax=Rheinheimera mangrovi TaxID=2498451 RepID=UPI000F8ECA4B|nr:efflux RND transporter periplasmic adaptor subunit [Rheinheimera mangrovi]
MFQRHLISLTAVTVFSLTLIGCNEVNTSDPRTDPPLVRTVQIQNASLTTRTYTGVVAAKVQSDLGFRVAGKIKERFVDTGQKVKRGQVLLRLDPVDLQLAANVQQAAVVAAAALAKQTADDEARLRALTGTGAISASAYDQAKAAADSAQAQLKAVKAQAEVADNAKQYTELVADADGIIMETLAEPGQVVSSGQTVARLAHMGPREAEIQLPETLRPEIGSLATATLFGSGQTDEAARLRQLSETADRLTRTFEARYVLNGALATAPLGSTVMIQLSDEVNSKTIQFQVPITALFDQGNGPGVWVVSGSPAKVSWLPVTVHRLNTELAFISGSFNPDAQIVTLGAHLLRDENPVRVAQSGLSGATEGASL